MVMRKVREKIDNLAITEAEAARQIEVGSGTLSRHLSGAYVRSDSLAKYRRWLAGIAKPRRAAPKPAQLPLHARRDNADPIRPPAQRPARPHRVVDLFGGCGGLSLGFDLADGRGLFQTVLSVDLEEPMVRVFNDNHPVPAGRAPVARQADLAEFFNEAEVLAYFLDHLAAFEGDDALSRELDTMRPVGLGRLVALIQATDERFVAALTQARAGRAYLNAYAKVSRQQLGQTSVLGFHVALKLPQPGTGAPSFSPPLWGRTTRPAEAPTSSTLVPDPKTIADARGQAELLWDVEIQKLRDRVMGSGSGQLVSSAQKIKAALTLLDKRAYSAVKGAWLTWRATRDALRRQFFDDESVLRQLRAIYSRGRQAHVLLGGPPCQGFSRIGRGKIRSLREQSVHVQADARAGDRRNRLMHQYVLFVAALAPEVFLFENVRHFQARVTTPEGTFQATDVLAEAIHSISHDGLDYAITSAILTASNHLVPQTRERFFMAGVHPNVVTASGRANAPAWCLTLPVHPPIPLKVALTGLPEPVYASRSNPLGRTSTVLDVEEISGDGPTGEYLKWVRQPEPGADLERGPSSVDAHCTRDSRPDDRAFFAMLGPGKRWMDYRCDDNPVVTDLASLVRWALTVESAGGAGLSQQRLNELLKALDGSLSIRLLLDRIPLPPGEVLHHLCAPNYLKKREGNHGDWLARLNPEAPSKTMVSHMGKDTYAYIHPSSDRTISVREAARVQSFPDWFAFGSVGLVDGYRIIGNAVPPLLSTQLALRVAVLLASVPRASEADADRSVSLSRPSSSVQPGLL